MKECKAFFDHLQQKIKQLGLWLGCWVSRYEKVVCILPPLYNGVIVCL